MRRLNGPLLRLMAVLVVVVAFLAGTGPADAASLDTQHRLILDFGQANCLIEPAGSPNTVQLSPGTACGQYYKWKGNNDYTIRNASTGYCLTGAADFEVTAAPCDGSAYQKWSESQFSGYQTGVMRFHNLGNDWYLDRASGTVVTAASSRDTTQGWWDCIDGMSC